ncbi:hypothetical protein BD626DRAFT_475134 [Schizophyllum amplum]|uniref:Uncharacterized protein n=1 Tax=Schizophyllum amplum TaxID=97359 RepID=A0A550CY87_9AGAR|nr:hypothetical protein BD626DRAFT_475134 [Auriculariopsis ampla]
MRASAIRLLEVVPKSLVDKSVRVTPRLQPLTRTSREPTVMEILAQKKQAAGTKWPANLRLENPVPKEALVQVEQHARRKLKLLLKER